MEPPAFSAALRTTRAAPGSSAVLHVPSPAGTPPFHFEWSRAGASLDDRFTSSDDPGGVRLTVSAARTGDSGVYTLQATNAAGKDTARVRLEVSADEAPTGDDPPTFLRRLQDLTVKVGTRTRFLVEIVSSTECKVTWYRNERRLMEAERVSLARDGTFWCADIATVSVDDTGRWTCTAENAGGRASCSAHLNVLVPKAYKRPEFVEELRALLTEQGTVSLECKVVGVPTPVLRWFKDSREIKAGDVFALTANAEDPTSLGTYTCEAVNCMGRAYSSSKVHVVGRGSREGSARPITSGTAPESPPIFTKELEDKFVRISEPLTLSCHIVVPPWPRSVVWYNKEGKVEPGERYHVVEDGVGGYLLEMPSAEWPDEGEWKCVATSSGGRIGFSSCYVSMDVPKNYRKPRFMENLQAVLTEEGLVSFECKVVGFPTPVLSWFKDGQELKPGDVYQLTGTNSLGSYCCIARNCMGQANSSAELTVEDIQNQLNEEEKLQLFSKNQAPKFIQGLKSVEAKIDEPFRFTIKVAIPPEPSVQWYRDDQPVDDSSRCQLAKEERGVFYLDIQSLEFFDQAEWKCVAVNDFGQSVTSCFLKLMIPRHYKKPRFLENLQAILSDEGAVNLECKVIGVPQPVLKWYKDGEELKPGDIHRIISGQDGTCCLGTYTCEAQNCMGIAASSASLLGFDDSMKAKAQKKKPEEQPPLQRNVSLSTIHEERSSQMYDTPVGDITLDDKAEISFSFDGKEVSVSLYETPDLTEEDAIQIMEMYADQISENVTEHNIAELPPLRFVKETSTSGNLLMEAIIIDVSPEYFASPEEDLRTEADVEDISIADENGPPQLSLDQDIGGEDYLEKTMDLLSQEKADIVPKKLTRKKSDSQRSADDFYSLSMDQTLSEDKKDDETQILSESFASARSLGKPKSKSSKPSIEEGQESSDLTKTILVKDEFQQKQAELETPVAKPKRERRSSRGSRRSSSGSEKSFGKSKEEQAKPQVVTLEQIPRESSLNDEEFKTKMTNVSLSLSKVINDVQIIERDIILKSELMSSAATASRSLEIISSLIKPLSEIHSIADAARESVLESREVSSTLFNNLSQPLKVLQQSLTIIEKCIDVESDNKTLVKKTCVAFIETCGDEVKKFMNEISSVTDKDYVMIETKALSEINSLISDMNNVIRFSADTIKTRNLLSEASEIKVSEASVEAKHLKDTQKAVFELKSPLNSLLRIVDTADEGKMAEVSKVKSSEVILNDMSASVQDLQAALEQIESLSVKESTTSLHKYNTEIIETVMESVLKLRGSFEQLSTETKIEEDEVLLKQALDSIKKNLSEISSQIMTIEKNVGSFDILQSENKLEMLQKMAQILISLENNLPRLENMHDVKTNMDIFHKNLTRVLENVIESNEASRYFILMEICDAVNRLTASIKNIDADNILSLASLTNTLRIIQDTFIKNVFDSELNCSILSNITDITLSLQEALNHADEISLQLESERLQDIATPMYEISKANTIIEHINHTIAVINTVKSVETTEVLQTTLKPVLESICPVLEELKRNIAAMKPVDIYKDERISEMSDASSIVNTLATPLLELNQNIITLNTAIEENIESLKENNEIMSAIAEPLHELHTTLQILQQDVISQYGEDLTPYDVSINFVSAVQNLQSCIVMIQEQPGVEGVDEMSTLEDISGIKTTAETIPSDRLVLPTAEETAIELPVEPFSQEIASSATAQALHALNEHITILQTPEVVDALDTLSEVSDYSSLKSVALGLGELHAGIEEILHPLLVENSSDIANLINTSKLAAIAEPMQELQQSLSVLEPSNIPIYEHILEIPAEKIHSVLESISGFKEYLGKCIHALFPAMETADKTIEISNKVEALRDVCENLKVVIETTKRFSPETPIKQEVIILEETIDNLLDATDVSKGIQIQQVKTITEELFEKVMTVQEELIQYTPHTVEQLAEEAKLIQAIDDIENNIAVLEQYDFVDLSRVSEITSCATPTLALEMESEPLVQMDDILQNAVNVLQDSAKETPLADLMILEDFFRTCKNEFTIIRLIISKPLSHKKIIRLIQEFTFLQSVINNFKLKRFQLQLSEDIDGYLKIFFVEADGNLKIIQDSLLQVINTQSEILVTGPLTKLETIQEKIKHFSKSKEVDNITQITVKFADVIEIAIPILQTAAIDMTEEIKRQSESVTTSDTTSIVEKIEDLLKYTDNQSMSPSVNKGTKEVLDKLTKCLQRHQDYKDATGTGKNLIILKCLSECAEILQASVLDKRIVVKEKIEENALKTILSEMLEPLQALHSQLANIQEQVASGIEDNSVSVDITSTESMIEAVSEIHKEIVQKMESERASVDNEEISLIMEADKKIHAIQDTLNSLENVPAIQELKEIAKPIVEVEKSLHNFIAAERMEVDTEENLPTEDTTYLLQHIDEYIQLIETAEAISAAIKLDKLQEIVDVAHELRDNLMVSKSEIIIPSDDTKLSVEYKVTEIAIKLKNALSALNVQAIDSTQELTELNSEFLEQFAIATAKLQNDLVVVTGAHTAVLAPSELVAGETKLDMSKGTPVERIEVGIKESISQQVTEVKNLEDEIKTTLDAKSLENSVVEEKEIVTLGGDKDNIVAAITATLEEQDIPIVSSDQITIEENKSIKSEIISGDKAVEELEAAIETTDKRIADKIEKMEEKVQITDTLKQCIEEFIFEDLTGSINKLSAVIDIEELKQTVTIAKELRKNIAMVESITQGESSSTELEAEKIKQGQLAQKLETALLTVQEQIFENYELLETVFDTSKLQKVTDVTVNLQSNLSTAVTSIATDLKIASDQIETLTEISLSEEQAIVATVEDEQKQLDRDATGKDYAPEKPAVDTCIEIIETKTKGTVAKKVKLAVVTEDIKSKTLKQNIEDFISDNLIETIDSLSTVMNIDQLKTSISLAEKLHEKIAATGKIVLLHTTEDLDSENLKQGQLVQELQTALSIAQERIFDNYQQLEGICDLSKLQELADITVMLQTQLVAVTLSSEEKEKSFDSDSTVVPSTSSIEAVVISDPINPIALQQAEIVKEEIIAGMPEVKSSFTKDIQPTTSGDTAIGTTEEVQSSVEFGTAEIKIEEEKVTENIHVVETIAIAEKEPTVESGDLLQHIEAFISEDMVEAIEELAVATSTTDLIETVKVAKELLESISVETQPIRLEYASVLMEESQTQFAELKQKFNEALTTLQTKVLDAAQEIAPLLSVEKLERISEAVTHLQADLNTAICSKMDTFISEFVPESSKEESMKQLENLLHEVSDKIVLSPNEKVLEDNEALRDSLDEVQTVIIKLKRDFDGANDTLNETLEDLECSVRSVQLQINEDSPPDLLKEACATLQLLVNNMSETNETCISESITKDIVLKDVINKCSKETEQTVQLLEIASNVDLIAQSKLGDIVFNLNILKDTLKSLREGFTGSAETLIERGTDITQSLDQIEEKVFFIEKEVESIGTLPLSVKENIIFAVHAVYGSISNMRSTVSSTQKQYMFENYGQPSENFLRSIKNLSSLCSTDTAEADKPKYKKLAKSLRNVLNHFEDIKFYINLDKTARLPSDAAFTKIILDDLKSNIKSISSLERLSPEIKTRMISSLKCVEVNLKNIEARSTLEVKEKIPIFKVISSHILEVTAALKIDLEKRIGQTELDVISKLPFDESSATESQIETTGQITQNEVSVSLEEKPQCIDTGLPVTAEKAEEVLEEIASVIHQKTKNVEEKYEVAVPSTSKQAQEVISGLQKAETEDFTEIKDETNVIEEKEKQQNVETFKQKTEDKEESPTRRKDEEKSAHKSLPKEYFEPIDEQEKKKEPELQEVKAEKDILKYSPISLEEIKEKASFESQPGTSKQISKETSEADEQDEKQYISEELQSEIKPLVSEPITSELKLAAERFGDEKLTQEETQIEKVRPASEPDKKETQESLVKEKMRLEENEVCEVGKQHDEELKLAKEKEEETRLWKEMEEKEKIEVEMQRSENERLKQEEESRLQKEKEYAEKIRTEKAEKRRLKKEKEEKDAETRRLEKEEKMRVQKEKDVAKKEIKENEDIDLKMTKEEEERINIDKDKQDAETKRKPEEDNLQREKDVTEATNLPQKEKADNQNRELEQKRLEEVAIEQEEETPFQNEKEVRQKETEIMAENEQENEGEKTKLKLVKEEIDKEQLEKKKLAKEKKETERLETEKLDDEKLEKETLEEEKLEKNKLENEKLHKENLQKEVERETLEKEKHEREKIKKDNLEKEKIEKEKLAKEKLEKEKLENEKLEKEKLEKEKLEKEKLEKEKLEKETLEKEKLEKENLEKEKLEKEKLEKDILEQEKLVKEKLEKEKLDKEKLEKEKVEKEKLEKEKVAKEKVAKDKLEKEKLEKEKLEKENLEKEKLEKENLQKEKLEKEKLEKDKLEKEKLEKEKLEKEKLAKEKLEKEKLEKQKLEKDKLEKEKLEKDKLEKEKLEKEKFEKEKLAKEKLEKEKLEKEKLEKEKLEKEKLEYEKVEKEKLEKEKLEKEKVEKEKLEKEKVAKENLEKEKLEKEKLEKENFEKEKLEKENLEKEKLEKEKLEKDKLEKEKLEKDKLEQEKLDKEKLEKEKLEKEKLEKEKLENEKLEKDKHEKEKLEKEKLEKEKLEKEKLEKENLEKEKLEKENLEKEKLEKEKLEKEKLEKEKLEKEKLEKEKLEKEKLEKEKLAKEKLEKKKDEKEKLEKEKLEKEKLEKEKLVKENLEKEKLEKEKLEKDKLEKEKLEKEKIEKEKLEKEKHVKENLAKERLEKEKLEKDKFEKEKLEKEKLEKEKFEKEKLEKEKREKEKLEKEKLKKEKLEKEKLEKEKLEKEKLEKEKLEKEKLEKEKREKEKLEKEKLEKEKVEKEELEKEKAAKDKLEKEKLEKEKLEKEKLEKEKLEKEKLEKEKLEKGNLEKEKMEKEKLEKDKLEKEKIEKEKLVKEKLENEKLEKEKLEKEKLEKEKLEKEKLEKEILEKEKLEKEKLDKEKLEKAKLEKEKLDKEKLEKEKLEKEQVEKDKLEKEKLEKEKVEKEKLEKEKLEKVKLDKEKLEKEKLEKDKLEKDKLEKEKLEKENLEREKLEKERVENDKLEKENLKKEKLEKEKLEKEKHDKEKLKKDKQETEKFEKQKLEREKLEKEKLEKEKLDKEKHEKDKLEKDKLEKEKLEQEKKKETLEQEPLQIEIEEKENQEREKLQKEKEKEKKENLESERKRVEKGKQREEEKLKKEKNEADKAIKNKTDKKRVKKAKEEEDTKKKSITSEKVKPDERDGLDTETRKIDNGDIKGDGKKKKIERSDSDDLDKKKYASKPNEDETLLYKNSIKKEEVYDNYLDQSLKESQHGREVREISKIKLLDANKTKLKDTVEPDYSRKLKSETKLERERESKFTSDESSRYIKEYHYEPTSRPKNDDKEKPRFIDHNHRDYTMEFARPSAYREKTMEVDNVSFEKNTGRGHIYKANTLMMEAQLRSSAPPRSVVPDSSRSSEPVERRPDVKLRSKALSEARSVLSEKRTASRDVRRKPVFSTYLTDRTAVEGSRVKLTCSVLSSTDPKVTWYKNGVVLDNKLKYRTKFTEGLITLEVLNAVPTDSAEYSCTVENENGSVNTSANLKVYPSFEASPIPPTFTRSIRDTFHLAENELVLECRIRGQPLPTITWLKDDKPVSINDRYQAYYLADGVCRLAINHPTPEDSGKYTCKAENSVWSDQITHVVNFTGEKSRLSPNLTTIERSRFNRQALESTRRPHFGNVLTDYKVTRGGTIGLQVEIRGAPTRVEWLREGRSVIETYSNARTYVEQELYTLALTDVTERESGLYTCRAWSSHGTVDMNAAITVVQPNEMEGKPAIIAGRPEKDVLISVGEDLNISFRAQGEPKPKVVFMKGIRDITNSQRVCKMTSDDYVKFTVKRSVVSDAGTYCVLARNAYGCDRAFVTVVVRQRASSENLISDWTYPMDDSALSTTERKYKSVPDRIPGEPSVVDGGNNWLSIAWPKPDPHDAAPVLAYKVESWLAGKEGGARWTELGITPLNSFDAFNLKQGEEYHFRVTPRNRYGWGESVQTSSPIGVGLAGDRPEFVDILPGQLKVLIGETANLTCSVKGKPVPEVVWMKNGYEVEEDGRVKSSFNGFNCSLRIEGIGAEDEARYSCEASNAHGRASTYARLAVVTDRQIWEADVKLKRERSADVVGEYPPQFTMRLRDRRVQATYPVRLTCQVVGSPHPTVTWFKDGEEVIFDGRHTKSQDEHFHTLEIAPTSLEDGGVYEAMARNGSGAISCHCSLVVDKGIRAYVAPEFCCGLEPLYRLNEGEELRISAVVEAYPTVGVTWYRDGVRLRPSRRAIMTLDRDGQIELALAFVTPRDAGVYTCTASNEVGRASTSGKVEVIEGDAAMRKKRTPPVVLSPDVPYSKEPMFVRKPRSSEAQEGDTVIIQCEVVGDPKPDVYWLRDFLKPDYYRDATHFKRVGDGPEYRFEIPHAKLDYTGAYSVVAKNVHGETKAIISLQILARDPSSTEEHNVKYGRVDVIPRFVRNLTDLLCHDGDAIEFECHVSGHPEPDIRWFHYSELIRECPDFEWSLEDGTARLKIKQVTAEDEGTYLCEASNNMGKATSSACLVVYPPGEPNTLSQRLRRPPALLSAASTPRSTPRSTPARSVSRTPGPDPRRLCSPSRQMPPKFYTYPFNKVVEEGDHVVFQCAVKGLPAPWATWDKDGVIITPSTRITIREKDEILRILEIEQVTTEDVGIYRVTLENDYGRVEASARLEVITQKGKFYAGVRAYSASPRKSLPYRRRSSSRQD